MAFLFSKKGRLIEEMDMERRREMRFPVSLKVAAREKNKQSILGLTKDFSRHGLRAVFDNFESEPDSSVELKIQKPNEDVFIPAIAEVRWKRPIEGKWEVGLRFKDFISQVKVEILDYAYYVWLRDRFSSLPNFYFS